MFRTFRWISCFWLSLLALIPKLKKAKNMEKFSAEHDQFVQNEISNWAGKLVDISGANITVIGEENITDETAVYVANHQGNFDVALMLTTIGKPRALLAKTEMKKMPIVRDWMEQLGCIFVDRKDPKQGLKAVMTAIKQVKAGRSITIFPEGTRSKCDKMGEFKAGSTLIATKAKAKIVPVTIDGSYKIMEKNKGFKITPADVKITIHTPIDTTLLSKEETENIDNIVKSIIESALPNQD